MATTTKWEPATQAQCLLFQSDILGNGEEKFVNLGSMPLSLEAFRQEDNEAGSECVCYTMDTTKLGEFDAAAWIDLMKAGKLEWNVAANYSAGYWDDRGCDEEPWEMGSVEYEGPAFRLNKELIFTNVYMRTGKAKYEEDPYKVRWSAFNVIPAE